MNWESWLADVRNGWRLVRRSPGPALLSILTLAVGIGAGTAMFSVVDTVLLRPLPMHDPERLMRIRGSQSYPDVQDWISETTQFQGFGAFRAQTFDLASSAGTERVAGALVSGGLFPLLGTRPHLGRLIDVNDDRPGADRVIVLSYGFWQRQFGGRTDIVGETTRFVDATYRVVGVLPADFELPLTKAEIVAAARAESTEFGFRGVHSLTAMARLADGQTLGAAQADLDALATRLAERYPNQNKDRRFVLQSVQEWLVGGIRTTVWLLFGAVGLFWLIACANVANLQVGRALGRRGEMAMRRAIGATRVRLIRQLAIEQFVMAGIAGVLGAGAAWWLVSTVAALPIDGIPRLEDVALNGRALLFTTFASIATGMTFGLVPALAATGRDPGPAAHGVRVHRGQRHVVTGLLVAEMAVSLVLMIGGCLLLNSYVRLMSVAPGFDPDRLLTFNLTLRPLPRLPRPSTPEEGAARTRGFIEDRNQFYSQVIERLRSLPGVGAVAASTDLPIAEGSNYHNISLEGRPVEAGAEPEVYYRGVNPGFFEALGMAIRRGRDFSAGDRLGAPHVAIVNETFARRYYGGDDPIGKRVSWSSGSPEWITIVGLVADVKGLGLTEEEVPALYGPFMQDGAVWRRSMDIAIRTSGDPSALAGDVRRLVASVDPSVPVMRLQTMRALMAGSVAQQRLALLFLGASAIAAMLLAAIGLYGAVAYAVRARTAEFGVRLALGARPGDVVRLALRQAGWCVALGLVAGVAGARAGVYVLEALLFGVAATDVMTYVVAVAFVAAIAGVAAVIPAARAARIDPLIVLRRS